LPPKQREAANNNEKFETTLKLLSLSDEKSSISSKIFMLQKVSDRSLFETKYFRSLEHGYAIIKKYEGMLAL